MDNDDLPAGRILTRREVLALFGGAGAALLLGACGDDDNPTEPATSTTTAGAAATAAGASATATEAVAGNTATAQCVVRPGMTEGPYYLDTKLKRADIRPETATGRPRDGAPLELTFNVMEAGQACTPLAGAVVDAWHCDALGEYSGVAGSDEEDFLRGYQETATDGAARFTTIVPGWYQGRTPHIHFKIQARGANGQAYEFTSQLFFTDAAIAEVYAKAPYAQKGPADTTNARDGIYRSGGDQLLLDMKPAGSGYAAAFGIALDLSDTQAGADDSAGGGAGR